MEGKTAQLVEALVGIEALLVADHNTHWSQHVAECRKLLVASDYCGIEKLLGSYGGMGSFNDVVVGYSEIEKGWLPDAKAMNETLNTLRTKAYELADSIRRNHAIQSN